MTLANLYLEPLVAADLAAVIALDHLCLGGLWSLDGYQREMESPNSDLLVLRRRAEDAAILGLGCTWRIVDEAHITLIYVHPHYQRQGLGQYLLHGLLSGAVQAQMAYATLEVKANNHAAIALYQKFGFQAIGRRRGYYQTTQEDALIFWRRGLQEPNFAVELDAWRGNIMCRLLQNGWQCQTSMPASS